MKLMKLKTMLSLRYLQNKKKTIMMISDFFLGLLTHITFI